MVDEKERLHAAKEPQDEETLAPGTKTSFRLPRKPSQPARSYLLRQAHGPTHFLHAIHKHVRTGANPQLEDALLSSVIGQFAARRCILGHIIRRTTFNLRRKMNEELSQYDKSHLTISQGWLPNFQARTVLPSVKSHGQSDDANFASAADALPKIRLALRIFKKEDIFDADEFGVFIFDGPRPNDRCTSTPRTEEK